MSEGALHVVELLQEALPAEDVVAGLTDPEVDRRVRGVFAAHAEPDFAVRMLAPERLGLADFHDRGIDGYRRLWQEWTGPFASFRLEIERMIDAGDRVVSLARMLGRTKTGGVEVVQLGAALWTFRDERLTAVGFYLDRDEALREAGLDPETALGDPGLDP